ncbi:glycosyltransferase family 2 protein [Polaribacter sp. PL03]|uniref:glycosyltransferase family 2 protein n=1 Tax=Polaribacter sp. PL03 TaxID=3088353 RepID=UPI0029CD4C07|nr:glycosyltransferase family 2 protein [Polaribacter sp. PL03]MDX6746068.1 glycosyltransferase family 2 protein [Polaribacter sp. PL03]
MRVGVHPARGTQVETDDAYHRIVIPVYIPNLEGYFKDSFEVLKLSLKSLYTTIHQKAKISVVSNGSCIEVNKYLNEELNTENIDELLIVSSGIGKINSIFKLINNVKEPLVTLADADVLFTTGWQDAVENVFMDYPKVGMVCPFSYSKGYRELTANIFFDNFFNKNIKISKIENTDALKHFAESIGNLNFYKDIHLKKGVTFQEKGKSKVFIGAGHFVATFKTDVFDPYTFQAHLKKMAHGERMFIDTPSVNCGLWRVSTFDNYVYHMGNTIVPMYNTILSENIKSIPKEKEFYFKVKRVSKFSFYVKNIFFGRIIFSDKVFKILLSRFGLSNKEANLFIK